MAYSPPPLPNFSIETGKIVAMAHQAGQIALGYFKNVSPQLKSDQTFLTEVDLQIEAFLAKEIKAVYPTHNLIGEEGTHNELNTPSSDVWVIDPLDGTTAFVQGLPGWGISIGLLHQGRPCFGLFYMPLLNDLTYTTSNGQVYCNNHILQRPVRREWGQKDFLAVNASAHRDFEIKTQRTRALGSIGANIVYTARRTAVGAFIPKAHVWDLVAGAAILSYLGGELRYINGGSINYKELLGGNLAPAPIVAAHPEMQAELREMIQVHPER